MKTITALTQDPLGYRTSRSQILAVRDFFLKVNQAKKVLLAGRMKQNDAFLGGKNAVLVISPPPCFIEAAASACAATPKILNIAKKAEYLDFSTQLLSLPWIFDL